jgi:hypothetical protein
VRNLIKSVVVIGACLVAALSMAQQSNGSRTLPQPSQDQMNKFMDVMKNAHKKAVNSIGLTADQKKKVAASDAKHMDKLFNMQKALMKAGMASRGKSDPATQKAVKEATAEGKAWQDELKAAMGEAKYKAYEQFMQKEMQKAMQAMMPKTGTGKGG